MLIPGDIVMRVLMLTRFSYTGSTGHVLSLAAMLNRQEIKTAVVMTDCPAQIRQRYQQYCLGKFPLITENREMEIERALRRHRADLIHVHAPALVPMTRTLAYNHRLPWGISIYTVLLPAQQNTLSQAAFMITGDPVACRKLNAMGYPASFIPEGIDLDQFKPVEKQGFRITFTGESGGYTEDSLMAVQKAAALADLPVEIICPEQPPRMQGGRFHGWLPSGASVLATSQVVLGRRRSLLEGMACGNAAIILGYGFGGLVEAGSLPAATYPDLNIAGDGKPCYRDIFYALSRLLKNRSYLSDLQRWGRNYIAENYDLRISAELTAKLYRSVTPPP